jgi:hypothetical protein
MNLLGNSLPAYAGKQRQLNEQFDSQRLALLGPRTEENQLQWKALIREGVPDKFKRKAIL